MNIKTCGVRKRTTAVILCATFLFAAPERVRAETGITVYFNGAAIVSDVAPEIRNDRVMVPIRAISEASGASVYWYEEPRTIEIRKNGVSNSLTIGYGKARCVNGEETEIIDIDAPPYIKDGRTLVPLRFVAERLGLTVDWNADTKTVDINTVVTATRETVPLGALRRAPFYIKREIDIEADSGDIYKAFEEIENEIAEKISGEARTAAYYAVGRLKNAAFGTEKAENISITVDSYTISVMFSKNTAVFEINTER
jgi:hypothetical protein